MAIGWTKETKQSRPHSSYFSRRPVASKRRLRRKACDGKIRHATIQDAKRTIYELNRKDAINGQHRGRMNAYYCKFCAGVHVGHG